MKRFGLSSVLFFWLLISVMVPTLLLSTLYLSSFKATLLEQEQEHLSQFADKKVKQVEDYISERIADVFTLSQSTEVIEVFGVISCKFLTPPVIGPPYQHLNVMKIISLTVR